MSRLILGTNTVSYDEPCYLLVEKNGPAPDSKSVRRYQTITVVRNADQKVQMRRDLGLAKRFKVMEFGIPGGVTDYDTGKFDCCHTVGELVDIADRLRSDYFRSPDPPQTPDLIKGYYDRPDKIKRHRKRLSQFGPVAAIVRG